MALPWEQRWCEAKPLGEGGQGTTYIVQGTDGQSKGVLKLLKKDNDEQARKRMRVEVDVQKVLSGLGASVPKILDTNVDQADTNGIPLYFVMDYVEGETLDDYVRGRKKLNPEEAIAITLQIADVIRIGHSQGFGHRDLKPKNLMVTIDDYDNRKIVVLDYGISFNNSEDDDLTRCSENFWNEFLSLPETNVIGGARRDLRIDVTMVCGLLFFCLTGRYPQLLRDSEERPPHRRPGLLLEDHVDHKTLVPLFDSFFYRGFNTDINKRFQTIDELVEQVNSVDRFRREPHVEDPKVVAARESQLILDCDRKTQLAEMHKPAMAATETLHKALSKIAGQLGRFKAERIAIQRDRFKGDNSYESLKLSGIGMQISIAQYSHTRKIGYRVVVKDDTLVVLKYLIGDNSKQLDDGEFMYSFPVVETPDWRSIEEDYKLWLNESMSNLRAQVLQQQHAEAGS